MEYILIPLVVVLVLYMWWSSRRRRAQQAKLQQQFLPGAKVMTNFGLFGTLVSVDSEKNKAVLETSPGNEVTVHLQTLARVEDEPTEATDGSGDSERPALDSAEHNTPSHGIVLNGEPIDEEPKYGERIDPKDPDGK